MDDHDVVRLTPAHRCSSQRVQASGTPHEIYPFLGSYFLAEAADSANADLCIHGHAHAGTECGTTPGGAPVRNVAQPVLKRAYAVYCLGEPDPSAPAHGKPARPGLSR
jgi:Icc-related predicted phosphoesterase